MGKPRLIILIRHAQSEGNKNRDIHQTVPDHRVKLTPEGWKQAEEAGRKLRSLLRPSDTVHFFTSPYRRTRETTEGILSALTSPAADSTPSPFPRPAIKIYEEPRLREQDFGNFQPCSAAMTTMWQERADYGHFFYRIPNGESAADAYDRVSGFNESLWRSFGEEDFASVCVLVTHGLMTRVFLMKWYHFSVEYFEDLRNVEHCEFVVMRLDQGSGKYVLQNQLRTWSELLEEREGKEGKPYVPVRKKWGGCQEGCEHGSDTGRKRVVRRQNTVDLFSEDGVESLEKLEMAMQRKGVGEDQVTQAETEDDPRGRVGPPLDVESDEEYDPQNHTDNDKDQAIEPTAPIPPKAKSKKPRLLSSNRLEILKTGRDGGGSRSGDASPTGSDNEDAKPYTKADSKTQRTVPRSMAQALNGELNREHGMGSGARADALGDQSDIEDEDLEELEQRKEEDRSFEGSVL